MEPIQFQGDRRQLPSVVPRRLKRLPLFTDFGFHNLGIGSSRGRLADAGRYGVTRRAADLAAFRRPSLRNVAIDGDLHA